MKLVAKKVETFLNQLIQLSAVNVCQVGKHKYRADH